MISNLAFILLYIDLNLSNMSGELLRYSITPYTDIFGSYFWGIFFGFIGAAIYGAGSGDSRIYLILSAYLVGVGLFFSIVLDLAIIAIFGLILTFLISSILYKVFVEPKA